LLAVIIALPFIHGAFARAKIAEQYQVLRAAGEPATLDELAQWLPYPPDGENRVGLYQQAFRTPIELDRDTTLAFDEAMKEAPPHGPYPEALRELGAKKIAGSAECLRLLHEAAAGAARFPLDIKHGYDMELGHMEQLRQAVRLLQLEAVLAVHDGDASRAVEALLAILATADCLRNEPILIPQLVRIACHGIFCDGLNRTLELTGFTEDQLARLEAAVRSHEEPEAAARGFMGERTFMLATYEDPRYFTEQIADSSGFRPEHRAGVAKVMGGVLWNAADQVHCMTTMAKIIQASRRPFPEARAIMDTIDMELESSHRLFPRVFDILLPALARALNAFARDAAQLRNAATALAVERFRIKTGQVPSTLEELVPEFLESVPIDPFDGQPLRYRRSENGYVVYSVSENLRDDGGVQDAYERRPKNGSVRSGDWIFEVVR
jgi:hypothetical protein